MQQMREAFPWDHGCGYLLRDRDAIYGGEWVAMTKGLGMEDVISAPRSPWQNPYVERLIGSIRRECLDHIIVWNQRSLRRTLHSYFAYYQRSRTTFSASQGRSGVENCSEARTRASRGDSSGGRTSPPLPAPSRLGLVRRCPRSAIMASDILPWSSNQSRLLVSQDQISSRHQLVFALAALRARTPCSAVSKLQSSLAHLLSYSG